MTPARTVDVTLSRALFLGDEAAGRAVLFAADLLGACAGVRGAEYLLRRPEGAAALVREAFGSADRVPRDLDAERFFSRLLDLRIIASFARSGERTYRVGIPGTESCGCEACRRERGELPPEPPCRCARCRERWARAN